MTDLADKHHDAMAFERASTLAWTQAQMQLHHLGICTDEAHLFQRLANHIVYPDATLRPAPDILKRGVRKPSTLWAQGISGDLPIVLVRVAEQEDLVLVRQLLRAHEYWRLKQLAVDLVILNDRPSSYVQELQAALDALIRMNQSMPRLPADDARGAVFLLRSDLVSPDVRDVLHVAARAVLYGDGGSLAEQINRARQFMPASAPAIRRVPATSVPETPPKKPYLEFFNGLGGFAENGREYVTILEGGACTPAPWINVIANPQFGFTVSTDGSGFTWSVNSQQNQLTPWSNDPTGDPPGEAIYVRDEETGELSTIGKAYSGLTDVEIAELTEHFKKQTIKNGGRYREVKPDIVLEVAFNSIQPSTRHASGLALRFPRIKAIRRDKNVDAIDTLAYARELAAQQIRPKKELKATQPA